MLLEDLVTLKINKDKLLEIKDSDSNVIESLNVKIESSHAGIINKNDVFYTPKSLRQGAETLTKPYNKNLQKKHYNKSVGPINKAYYEASVDSTDIYLNKIESATTPVELVDSVNEYLNSSTYKNRKTLGLGALFIEGHIFDTQKIQELKDNAIGHVSIAGDSSKAYCSICAKSAGTCAHDKGKTYNRRKAFVIADSAKLDHVSFEEYPADAATRTYLLQDEDLTSNLNITDITQTIKGTSMKLTLQDFKDKLANTAELYEHLKINKTLVLKDSEQDSDYLFTEEKLLPLNTKQAIYIAKTLLVDLEDSEDKVFLASKVEEAAKDILGDITEEALALEMTKEVEDEQVEATPVVSVVAQELTPSISETTILAAISELTSKLQELQASMTVIQDSTPSKLLEKEVVALRSDLKNKNSLVTQLTTELKDAILIEVSSKIEDSAKKTKLLEQLSDKSISEIKTAIALLDSVNTAEEIKVDVEVAIQDATEEKQKDLLDLEVVSVAEATEIMDNKEKTPEEIEIEDSVNLVSTLITSLELEDSAELTQSQFAKEYKKIVATHGFKVAKQFADTLKNKHKIK